MEAYEVLKALGQISEEVAKLEDLLKHASYLTSPRYQGDALIRDRCLWINWRIEQAKQLVSETNTKENIKQHSSTSA
jgi:hypothetical protein